MIEVDGLTKYYGSHAAIRDLKFRIDKGEVIGFLGLNGAGKSTTLRILGCVLLPTAGRVMIDGFDVVRDPHEIRKRIGFLPDRPPLYDEMTVEGYLSFVAELRGVDRSQAKKRVADAAEKTGCTEVLKDVIASLSHGYRQRVGLAQSIVHNPALLILDEPTSGLDPVQIVEMRQLIRNLRGDHTILLSSHNLPEISQTCDRLLVINKGEITGQGTEAELADQFGGSAPTIEIEVVTSGATRPNTDAALAALRGVSGVKSASVAREAGGQATLAVSAPLELRPALVRALVAANVDVLRIDRSAAQLETTFLKLTQGKETN
jgi:ABC-2 type transport system ATP-binding protein